MSTTSSVTTWQKLHNQDAKELAEQIGNYLNHHSNLDEVAEYLGHEHRTLQQCFTKLCLAWFKHLTELPEGCWDLRNEYSVKLAREIRASLEEKLGRAWNHTPFI